eukprot:1581489-Amphidinium_carterae.1
MEYYQRLLCFQSSLIMSHEPVLVYRTGVITVWTDGSGRHSADLHHRRCGLGNYTDTQEHVWLPIPGLRQSAYRAEFLAVVRELEECQPHEVVSDWKGVVKAVQDYAMKVYLFWPLVGPQLRDRPEEQPRVKLPTERLAPPPAAPARLPDTDAPFQLGAHQRV